ncbi:MAG TPA: acyltransferase [Hydrogenophaga sp.]|uniref:acyltransferase family protein n=1 Tax=Hydrogenophaga sp. TaxID=1904254 RepID=UPI002C408316|nr:acyltransferase [Hydrogenophaga sp.]HSX92397.1 acyltransferase [Hydrogenophaga sp.]
MNRTVSDASTMKPPPPHRADIDGLRALAVVPVILLHAGFDFLPGGFLGVDVFFVISGYLITGILTRELSDGSFSIVRFYERRARRILPALVVVMLVSSVLAYWLMLPGFLENFGQSLVATSLFANNILLLMTSGYWDLESEFKPLLHTWSLGVEEQFYLLFPLLLLALNRRPARLTWTVIAALTLASLGLAEWLSTRNANAAFYLLPTRAWELLLGALTAMSQRRFDSAVGLRSAMALSSTGIALLAWSYWAIDHTVRLPALPGLAPVLGTCLLLGFSRPGSPVARLLAVRPLVAIGLISYSAYLWHQPLMAFSRIAFQEPPDRAWYGAMVLFTFVLAWLTWRCVEQPFRLPARLSRARAMGGLAVASVAVLALGLSLHVQNGLPQRLYDGADLRHADMYIQYNMRVHGLAKDSFTTAAPVRMLVMGNSYARDFANMVLESRPSVRLELVYSAVNNSCMKQSANDATRRLMQQATIVVLASGDIDTTCFHEDREWIEGMGKQLFVVGTKHFGYNLNWIMQRAHEERRGLTNALTADTIAKEARLIATVPAHNFIPLMEPVLRAGRIPITDENGHLLSADRVHLTRLGASYFGARALRPSPLGRLVLDAGLPSGQCPGLPACDVGLAK